MSHLDRSIEYLGPEYCASLRVGTLPPFTDAHDTYPVVGRGIFNGVLFKGFITTKAWWFTL